MRTAERLYAEHGLASVSMRKIGAAAGQRNQSAVQYHFVNRDGLIKAILKRHAAAIETHRFAMVEALSVSAKPSLEEQVACLIMPTIEHHIALGTPSWCGRFLAQVLVEPALREDLMRTQLNTPSIRRLDTIGRPGWLSAPRLAPQSAMLRHFAVHVCAELEYDLAHGRVDPATAEVLWRRLGQDVIEAICGQSTPLLGSGALAGHR